MPWAFGSARGGHGGGGVAAGGATHLAFSVQPTNVVVNSVISPTVQVQALRGDGSVDTSFSGTITIARGAGASNLTGTLSQTAVVGVANFNDLALNTIETGDTLVATAAALTSATSSTFNVTSSGASPILVEDFSTYTSTSNMQADPRGIYSLTEDVPVGGGPDTNGGQFVLDTTVGYPTYGLTQSMRMDYGPTGNSSGPGDYQVTRDLKFPSTQTEVWVESVEKGSSTFTIDAWPGYAGQKAWKHFFGRINGASGRFSTGSIGRWVSEYPPGGQELDTGTYAQTHDPGDNTWHVFRYHWKVGSSGILQVWMDGVKKVDTGTVSVSGTNIYGLSIGQTFNNGPIQNMSYWWGSFRIYNTNPGW